MASRSLNRKDFLTLSVSTLVAGALVACGDDPADPAGGSGSGTGGGGTGGSGTAGSSLGGGGSGTAGSSAGSGTSGSAGTPSTGGGGASAGGAGGSGGASGGTGGGGGSGGAGGNMCNANIMVTSSPAGDNHTHTLTVPMADVMAGAEKTYETGMGGGGDHTHWVKITAADFTALKGGGEVKKRNCGQGPHEYVLKCGGGGAAPVAPADCAASKCGGAMDMTCP